MEFTNSFDVDGPPAAVIAVFEDMPLLASFLPGASVGEREEDGSYPGQLAVSFGPKRLVFKGALVHTVQREQLTGELSGQASADVRGAHMTVTLTYRLSPTASGTRVDAVSEADVTGILAEFARAGGTVVTQALLDQFSQRFSEHMRAARATPLAGDPALAGLEAGPAPKPDASPQPLSGFALLFQIIKAALRRHMPTGARDSRPKGEKP
ncbi:MAG: SRPBCC domain-containing protein [Reyranellaceae bacterium]